MLRPLPKQEDLSNRELLGVLTRTLPDLIRSAPGLVSLMLGMAVVQGLVPALTILLGKWTVDGVGAVMRGEPSNLTLLAVACAGVRGLRRHPPCGVEVFGGWEP